MPQLTFRTIFGGLEMPSDFRDQHNSIKGKLKTVDFDYTLDLCVTVGADMITVTHPTGLRSFRINQAQMRVTGTIFVNNTDIMRPKDHRAFLRKVVHEAVSEIFDRMQTKKIEFSKSESLDKIAFLSK